MDDFGTQGNRLPFANYKYAEEGQVVERIDGKAKLPIKNSQGIYEINDEKELRGFADIVKGYNQYKQDSTVSVDHVKAEPSAKAILKNNIEVISSADGDAYDGLKALLKGTETIDTLDSTKKTALEDLNWVPIGENNSTQYSGTFNGAGYSISGLYCNIESLGEVFAGLFGYIGEGGEIKNLGVKNSYISGNGTNSNGSSDVGGVVGMCNGTIISSYGENNTLIGKGTMSNVGGVVGFCTGMVTSSYGANNTLTGNGSQNNVGGVVGTCGGAGGDIERIVESCYGANNKISGTGNNSNVGGVIGICSNGGKVKSCYGANIDLTGKNKGGICGIGVGTISNCYYLKDIDLNKDLFGIGTKTSDDNTKTRATTIREFKSKERISVGGAETVVDALNAERKVFIKNTKLEPGSHEYLLLTKEYKVELKIPVRVKINYDPSNNLEGLVSKNFKHEFFRKVGQDGGWKKMLEEKQYFYTVSPVENSIKINPDGSKTQDFIFNYYIYHAKDSRTGQDYQFGFNKKYPVNTYLKQDVGGGKKLFIDYGVWGRE
ncbi:MAG: hypothetical protein J6C55_04505 [Oscillospiraceae bacterium]|nr:hypothetical protein [Oscillospiraceae bacterium]